MSDAKAGSPYGYPWAEWLAREDPQYAAARAPLSALSVGEGKELSIKHREMVIIGILAFRGREDGVVAHMRRAVQHGATSDPRNEQIVRYHLALLLTRAGRFQDALTQYTVFAQKKLSDPEMLVGLGLAGMRIPSFPNEVAAADRPMIQDAGNAGYTLLGGDSPGADEQFEALAWESATVTRRNFGKTIRLFAPLYLSNECINNCAYCGFSRDNAILRTTLELNAVEREARHLAAEGFRNLLLVAGEHPRFVSNGYLEDCVRRLAPLVPSVALEVAPMETPETHSGSILSSCRA